jgi:hypothetical protein
MKPEHQSNPRPDPDKTLCIYEGDLYREGISEPTLWMVNDVITIAYPMTEEAREKGQFLKKEKRRSVWQWLFDLIR